MKKVVLVLFLGFYFINVNAQLIRPDRSNGLYQKDSTSHKGEVEIQLDGLTKYTDYKIISFNNDTTVVDTTLTFKKDLIFNYLRKDNFELLAFHNQGQTFNKLGYNFENNSLLPTIGANAKQFNYYKVEDISYYEVPTPTSEIFYRTGLEQGQVLNAFLTMNTSRRFNFSVAYKGLRSLGKYRNTLASHGNFRTTFNYYTENKRYYLRGHFSSFDLYNDENGGLTDNSIFYFENNDPNYADRGRLDVNFTNANNMLEGKRYYFEQSYTLFSNKLGSKAKSSSKKETSKKRDSVPKLGRLPKNKFNINRDSLVVNNAIEKDSTSIIAQTISKDSIVTKTIAIHEIDSTKTISTIKKDSISIAINTNKKDAVKIKVPRAKKLSDLKIGHTFMYETKHYRYNQSSANSIFGDAFTSSISDHTSYQKSDNQFYLQLNSPYTGTLKAKINYYNYNYHYNSVLYYDAETIPSKINGNAVAVGADWKTQFGNVYLNAGASSIIVGNLTGSSIKAAAMIKKDSVFSFKSFAEFASKTPDFNTLLYQSGYKEYNWKNNFNNEKISTIGVEFISNKWGSFKASYNLVDNYTYFNENAKPVQASETLNYVKVKASKAISYKKLTLDNTVMYQNVSKGSSFFRVPELVTRNTLYYSSYVFKGKPMYLQTGVTFKYFTAFKANAYNPLLSEFTLQNTTEIGNFPVFDFFTNIQIRRTRIFLKVENLSASFTGRNYYSAPNYPYRDLTVRFGVVWNWFI
tara:strand:- start:8830 stop:11064 length:2235 start_codon:yes stop_codon:yes gene_type:complete